MARKFLFTRFFCEPFRERFFVNFFVRLLGGLFLGVPLWRLRFYRLFSFIYFLKIAGGLRPLDFLTQSKD